MRNWGRELGEAIAQLPKADQEQLLEPIKKAPPKDRDLQRQIVTGYTTEAIRRTQNPEEIPKLLELAIQAEILAKRGKAESGAPYFITDTGVYTPADTKRRDRQAEAILKTACRRNSELRNQKASE